MYGPVCDTDWLSTRYKKHKKSQGFTTFRLSEEIFERWDSIPLLVKKEAARRMRVFVFWLPTLLQPDDSITYEWALDIGLISVREITLGHIFMIQAVERILHCLELGSLDKEMAKNVFSFCNMLNLQPYPETLENVVKWLEHCADPNLRRQLVLLGDFSNRLMTFEFIFTEYAKFIREMSKNHEKTMSALMADPDEYMKEQSEKMKKKGNELFQQNLYEEASKKYSEAIRFYPDNHILYGNRALCYIKCKDYLKAATDGKRAILIQPLWAKGHYRYCEALYGLDEKQAAFEANTLARFLFREDPVRIKDLYQQFENFVADCTGPENPLGAQSSKVGVGTKRQNSAKASGKSETAKKTAAKVTEIKMGKKTGKSEKAAQMENRSKDPKTSKSVKELNNPEKKKPKNQSAPNHEERPKATKSKAQVCKELRLLVQDAHSDLNDSRSRNAEQGFSEALELLESVTLKEIGLSNFDVLLLLFGRVSALTEIGQPEELLEAEKLLQRMKSYEERTFQCLIYYALGRLYLRENRFKVALKQFKDSMQMVKNQITPGKLTWPLTKEIVKETKPEYFKEILESSIELCKFPPAPDAVCRHKKCLFPLKSEIYFTDPDFKGYIQICCSQSCIVEFHVSCWKSLKTTKFSEKNEKDILHERCLTPDCCGKICCIKIFGPTGLIKCKFETAIVKPEAPRKPKLNQKCISQKKLKSKEEQKLKRKQRRCSFQENQATNDEILQEDNSESQSPQKVWLVYRDRVLLQIRQNLDLLHLEKGLQVSVLTTCLKPWLELDLMRGNQIAGRLLNWEQEHLETLGQAVELLLERKNRVWGRILIQRLGTCVDINPKLCSWAYQLDDAGLNAAQTFIDRHSGLLEQLDLARLLDFEPLKETILEKLGTRPELLSSIGLTVTEYLKQASPNDMRLFIWTLEEHREHYEPCHAILDEYFEVMDGNFSVLKKPDESGNNSPMRGKSRGRKKKKKGLNVTRIYSQRDEWEQDFFEDDSLSFLHPADSFSVPNHLREEVADFEEQYNSSRNLSNFKNVLDNNPDPAKENLYDYFTQILEEHGPLVTEDPLLVGELENFPVEARAKIETAGGFAAFLLESPRFIMIGSRIGLAKHAVSLQQAGHGASLDELDEIGSTDFCSSLDLYTDNNFPDFQNCSFAPTHINPVWPNPHVLDPHSSGNEPLSDWAGNLNQTSQYLPNGFNEPDLHTDSDPSGLLPASESPDDAYRIDAAVQTCPCPETMSNVAVNTELYERFEISQGDINKKLKSNMKLEEQINTLKNKINPKISQSEDVIQLEEEIKKITTNIQVTNTELGMFQQKLEEEVKKDQKEKKANQEELKSLKTQIDQLMEEKNCISKNIREKKISHETKLNEFLEISNQSAAEKMSLEDEIARCRSLIASCTKKSVTAQLYVLESRRDRTLQGLRKELEDAKALLHKLDDVLSRGPHQELESVRNSCRVKVEEVEKNISVTERQFKEQMEQVKSSGRVAESPRLNGHKHERAASQLSATAAEFVPSAPASSSAPSYTAISPGSNHATVFERTMESLAAMFPDYSKLDLMKFVKEFRLSCGGSLNNMALEEVVSGVTQLILDHQERLSSARAAQSSPAKSASPSLGNQPHVWRPVGPPKARNSNALNMEDPCIICHEDMDPDDTCVLECRHSFHEECIRMWLKEQRTCPTCRNHALMSDDFPKLSTRRRQRPLIS